jgi:hypothetical protein
MYHRGTETQRTEESMELLREGAESVSLDGQERS